MVAPLLLATLIFEFVAAQTPVYLAPYLQPDVVTRDEYLSRQYCSRPCILGEEPRICYYKWTVELYSTMGYSCGDCPTNTTACNNPQCIVADGYERGVLSVNRRIPGPRIEVCLGDRIVVDVTNALPGRTTTIHWHGVFQKGTQYMDGVPGLTQCGITEGNTFRYDFKADNEGTHFWHSHDGLQKLDGLEGNLVIRTPQSIDPNGYMYDFDLPEHEIFISDWVHEDADSHFPGLRRRNSGQDADSFLVNGKGRTVVNGKSTGTPFEVFSIDYGKRYRLRLVAGLCTVCGAQVTFENQQVYIIATDGNPVAPELVDSIVMFSGERYDVVLEATNSKQSAFWIHVKGLSTCVYGQIYTLALMQYEGVGFQGLSEDPGYEGFALSGKILNPENGTCGNGQNGICTTQLQNSYPVPNNILFRKPDVDMIMTFGFQGFKEDEVFMKNRYDRFFVSPEGDLITSVMNNVSFVAPPAPPLSQPGDIPPNTFCPLGTDGIPTCPAGSNGFCECTNVVSVPLGSVVQITLSDVSPRADLNHPFHLHGYAFYVLAEGQYSSGEDVNSVHKALLDPSNFQSEAPVLRDAIAVPSGGYTVIKFLADNPGIWFFHCHFEYHLATGMAIALQVGTAKDLPPVPAGFPTCGDFTPTVYT